MYNYYINILKREVFMGYLIILLLMCLCVFISSKKIPISPENFTKLVKANYERKNYDFLYFGKNISYPQKRKFLDFIEDINDLEELFYDEEVFIIIDDKPLKKILKDLKLSKFAKRKRQGVYIAYLKTIILSMDSLPMNDKDELKVSLYENIKVASLYNCNCLINLAHEIGHLLESVSESKLAKNNEFKKSFKNERLFIFPKKEDKYYRKNINEYVAQTIAYYLVLRNKLEYHENIFLNESYDTYSLITEYIKEKERVI